MTKLCSQVHEASAFLEHFLTSDWASCHVSGGGLEMFVAREAGHANPMLGIDRDEITVEAAETLLTAPHLGTLVELARIGSHVAVGQRYGMIELLGEPIDLVAEHAGTVRRHIGEAGALVQYDEALVALS